MTRKKGNVNIAGAPVRAPLADAHGLRRRIRVARGEEPGDLLLDGGLIVDVFTATAARGSVVVADGVIAGVGPWDWDAAERIDLGGRAVIPGLIDAHMHIESTLLSPAALAAVVVPRGTAAIIADPHEIANVLGVRGVKLLLAASRGLALDAWFMAPSCVPALPWEHAGAALGPAEIAELLGEPGILGLAEMMNFPGVLAGDDEVLEKIAATQARGAAVDGHAPGVSGRDLVAYAAAGIRSDHESTTVEEVLARASLGMLVQVREGSIARNLDMILPLLAEDRLGDWCLCTDDVHPDHLLKHGHVDGLLRRVVAAGVPAARAVRHATLVPARHYGLAGRGAVAPGWRADLAVVEDLERFEVGTVIKNGRVVARDGAVVDAPGPGPIPQENTVHLGALDESAFALHLAEGRAAAIGIVPDQIVTTSERPAVRSRGGRFEWDAAHDVAIIASIERHRATGSVGVGLVQGFSFARRGAIGSSVAHDSHNLIVAGTHPAELLAAARALAEMGGGFVVVRDGAVAARLPLPVAGLLSNADAPTVCRQLREARAAAAGLGCARLSCPFGTLSFLALPVIPALKITDQGLWDVVRQSFVT